MKRHGILLLIVMMTNLLWAQTKMNIGLGYFGKNKAEECLRNFISTLTAEESSALVHALNSETEFNHFKPTIYGIYSDAKELGLQVN